jgi:hypothetical protein
VLFNQLHRLLLATDASRSPGIKAGHAVNTTSVDQSHNPFAQSNLRQHVKIREKFEEIFFCEEAVKTPLYALSSREPQVA